MGEDELSFLTVRNIFPCHRIDHLSKDEVIHKMKSCYKAAASSYRHAEGHTIRIDDGEILPKSISQPLGIAFHRGKRFSSYK